MKKLIFFCICAIVTINFTPAQTSQLWGTTLRGGTSGTGTIYTLSPDGSGFRSVFSFNSPQGYEPRGSMLYASNGKVYGTCHEGGIYSSCTIYCYDPASDSCRDVHDFDGVNGDWPKSGLIEGPDQILYGVVPHGGQNSLGTQLGYGVLYSFDIKANLYTPIHAFADTTASCPYGTPVLVGTKLFGMTSGVTDGMTEYGCAIYSYDISNNSYATLHRLDHASGNMPRGGFVQHSNGKLYGFTSNWGANGWGTIISFDPVTNQLQKLFDFDSITGGPVGNLMLAGNGKLYGTTSHYGITRYGTIFSFDVTNNSYATLHHFTNTYAGPMGNLYEYEPNKLVGTTSSGGLAEKGSVFTYDVNAGTINNIHSFNSSDGLNPSGGLIALNSALAVANLSPLVKSLIVYPNPATTQLNLKLNDTEAEELQIFNTQGKLMSYKLLPNSNCLDIENLPNGTYIAEIKTSEGLKRVKWVKM